MQKQTIGLQFYRTIPQRVTILHDNCIDFNVKKYVFKDLNEIPPSDDWFPYVLINSEANNKLDKTKGQLAGNEMEKETKYYVEYLHHNPNWLKTITIEIDKLLINHEHFNFFMKMYMKWSKDDGSTS